MEDGRLYELRGGSAGTLVVLRGVPCLLCASDAHPRMPITNDFRAKLHENVLFRGEFPVSRARRFGRMSCYACGRRLRGDGIGRDLIESEVRIDGAAITIQITAALSRW
jgi:hypothetical protein